MLPGMSLPASLTGVLSSFAMCFTTPTFRTCTAMVVGLVGRTSRRTVCGMWIASGLSRVAHHGRAHSCSWGRRSRRRWLTPCFTVLLPCPLVARPARPRRGGADHRAVATARRSTPPWQHDGSAQGPRKIGFWNNWVIVADRRHGADPVPPAVPTALPATATWTCRLQRNAILYDPAPPRTSKRGRPALKGKRLGTPADMAATATWRKTTVTRYGRTDTVYLATVACLWHGAFGVREVRVILVRETNTTTGYDLALVSTDLLTAPATVITRYAARSPSNKPGPQPPPKPRNSSSHGRSKMLETPVPEQDRTCPAQVINDLE